MSGIVARIPPLVGRQGHHGQPEALDGAHRSQEAIEVDRLGDVGIGAELVAAHDVVLRNRAREHDDRRPAQLPVGLALAQDLHAALARQVEVEDHEIGKSRRLALTATPRIICRPRSPSSATCRRDGVPASRRTSRVRRTSPGLSSTSRTSSDLVGRAHLASSTESGTVKLNSVPPPAAACTSIVPPCRSTTRWQMARPIPVPSYSSRPCRRWKIWKMRSACSRLDADAVVADPEAPAGALSARPDLDPRRAGRRGT